MSIDIIKVATPQTFVDALRKGDFPLASCFEEWAQKKHPDLAGTGLPEDMNNLIGILLAQTDFSKEDVVPLVAAFDSSSGIYQAKILVFYSGVETYLNLGENPDDVKGALEHILSAEKPSKALHKYIDQTIKIPPEVNVHEAVEDGDLKAFKLANRETIEQSQQKAAYLANLNNIADNYRLFLEHSENQDRNILDCHQKVSEMQDILKTASFYSDDKLKRELLSRIEDIAKNGPESPHKYQLISQSPAPEEHEDIKAKIADYLDILYDNPVINPEKNPKLVSAYNNRLQAAQNILLCLHQGKLKEEVTRNIERHTKTIERNNPGLIELGVLGWIQNKLGLNKGLSNEKAKFKEAKLKLQQSRKEFENPESGLPESTELKNIMNPN